MRAIGMEGEVMGDLTEKQMVEKANLALEIMGTLAEEKPDKVKFVGASRMNGTGGVLYEMNEEGAAEWLRKVKVMELFMAKMGSMIDFRAQTYEIIVDWVPTTLDITQAGALEIIEQTSGLSEMAIREVQWIKPTRLRSPGQRTALAIFGFAT